MSTFTIALSTDAIIENIYALTALHHMVNGRSASPEALHRDHRSMLAMVVKGAIASCALKLMPHVADTSIGDGAGDDASSAVADDVITVTVTLPSTMEDASLRSMRLFMEQAVGFEALSRVYLNFDDTLSCRYASDAALAVTTIRTLLSAPPEPLSLTPSWM